MPAAPDAAVKAWNESLNVESVRWIYGLDTPGGRLTRTRSVADDRASLRGVSRGDVWNGRNGGNADGWKTGHSLEDDS